MGQAVNVRLFFTWFYYQLIAKPGHKVAIPRDVTWPKNLSMISIKINSVQKGSGWKTSKFCGLLPHGWSCLWFTVSTHAKMYFKLTDSQVTSFSIWYMSPFIYYGHRRSIKFVRYLVNKPSPDLVLIKLMTMNSFERLRSKFIHWGMDKLLP